MVTRELEQWFFRITQYADELLEGLNTLGDWPEKVVVMQRNWIGRSEGARIKFPVAGAAEHIEIFTTRIDTIYGATFVLLAPEHPMVDAFAAASPDPEGFRKQLAAFRALDREARLTGAIEKEGFDTGRKAINPFTNEEVPIWIANFVLAEYGTGAIMAVPAHDQRDFEFARKYGLPIRVVVVADPSDAAQRDAARLSEATTNYGTLVDSGPYSGQKAPDVIAAHDPRRGGAAASARAKCSTGSRTGASRGSATGARRFRWCTARRTGSWACRTTSCQSSCRRSPTSAGAATRRWPRCRSS